MHKKMKMLFVLLVCAFTTCSAMNSYAIRVKVMTTSKKVMGLGFTLNGKKYGGPGATYTKRGLPRGDYAFGVRTDKDIPCTYQGNKTTHLTKSTTAMLKVSGKTCTVQIS